MTFVDAETTSIDNHRNNQMTKENYTYHFNYILLGGSSQLNDPITYPVSARESLYFIQLIKMPDECGEKKWGLGSQPIVGLSFQQEYILLRKHSRLSKSNNNNVYVQRQRLESIPSSQVKVLMVQG